MSIDGHIDDASAVRLHLSNDEDYARVAALRASCDAILVGANTIRRDNPRLVVGDTGGPIKVTLTRSGDLDPSAAFFTTGAAPRLVYASAPLAVRLPAEVIPAGSLSELLEDLAGRGVRRLLVEGGGSVQTQFLEAGLVDELQLAIAPFFVSDPDAPRIGHGGTALRLIDTRQMGDVIMLRYLGRTDHAWLQTAVDLSRACPPSTSAFSVGAVIVDASGRELARGYSRDTDPTVHAEESALSRLDPDLLRGATLYTSLEPCTKRASRPRSCTSLIIDAGIGRLVYGWREPDLFADCTGAEDLRAADVEVIEIPALAAQVQEINSHLIPDPSRPDHG